MGRVRNKAMLSPALVLAAVLVHLPASTSALALAPNLQLATNRPARTALSYSHEGGGEPLLPLPPPLSSWRARDGRDAGDDDAANARRSTRRIPRRAVPHVHSVSNTDAAVRAGYIIRQMAEADDDEDHPHCQTKVVRPLRRVVHRSRQEQEDRSEVGKNIQVEAPSVDPAYVHVRNRPNSRRSRLSLSRQPQLDEFLDTPENLQPNEEERRGARRVTFKATRVSSKAIASKPSPTLTEYMSQPVSQYSLLSFHDAEGSSGGGDQPKSRRWFVRRLTAEEAEGYMDSPSDDDHVIDESNLFRLAVPLLPLIGWDLTPVIDLEVTPPKHSVEMEDSLGDRVEESLPFEGTEIEAADVGAPQSADVDPAKWRPLRGIRKRMRSQGEERKGADGESENGPPVVKIRSLRVSLLSTQEEVKEVMSNNNVGPNSRKGRKMQREALEMVSKVEEWLRPHITFEAELSWDDSVCSNDIPGKETPSTVTVKSTAITSLTIPRIPSDILRATVPSGFLVKRLGATLTSQALAICLPRFLRQLEKDYERWASSDNTGEMSNVPQ
ncbi:hypothetical protein ACHAXT_010377 [Thalassiosira profunda]